MKIIDLRSDTVTRPNPAMRAAMADAEVGDDVFGEDPTVNRLEKMAAELLGKEAALFVTSGTQGNLLALLSHCRRGDEYIAGSMAHCYRWEGGGAAAFGGIQPQSLEFEPDGTLDPGRVEAAIKPVDDHYARTRLICLENTQAGKPLPLDYLSNIRSLADHRNLSIHLDGARLFNASVQQLVPVSEISRHVDTLNVCLSKGLGAPVGSLLCGSCDFVREARHWRKVAGGGMRQAGILAAASIYALENNIERLAEDHAHAKLLADGLSDIEALSVEPSQARTNMVFVTLAAADPQSLENHLRERSVLVRGARTIRLVTHLDISAADIDYAVDQFRSFFYP